MSEQGPDDIGLRATDVLIRWRADEQRLERELDAVQIRLEILREGIAALSGQRQRRGGNRRQWPSVVAAPGSQQPLNANEQGPADPEAA